jgi:peptidyl-prolyl cis-trans isomerase D
MLKFFRKHARGWFMVAVMAVIIIVFVLYFGTDRSTQHAAVIAIVDGRTVSMAEFHAEYERTLDLVRQRYGANLTAEMLKQLNLKQKTYDDLINRHVIISKAEDLKVRISDEELRGMIMSISALQTNGMFDERKYRQMLRYNKASAEDFEALQRVNLMATRIESMVREGIKVSEAEALDLFVLQNQKINLAFVRVSSQDIRQNINPSKEQLENYLSANSAAFRRPEQVKIKYFHFPAEAYAPAAISDSELRDYYNLHKDSYHGKDGKQMSFAEARGLIFKELRASRGAHKAQAEAKKARDVIYQENNFAEYAEKNRLPVRHAGFFPIDNPPREFLTVKGFAAELIELKAGEVSRILSADNGYYLVEIVEKKAAYLPPLKEIESEVRQHFVFFERNRLAAQEARLILDRIKAGEPLEKAARAKGLPVNETGFFRPGEPIPKLGPNQGDADTLYQLSLASPYPDNPLFINNAYFVFKLKNLSKVDMKDFAAKKEVYERMLLTVKQEEAMRSWLAGNKEQLIREKRINIKKQAQDL